MEVTSILFEITRQSNPPISQFNRPCHVFKSVWSMFLCNISYVLFYYIDMSKGLCLQVSVNTWRRYICHCCFANVCTNLLVSLYISSTMVHILIYVEYVWVAPCIIKWPMTPALNREHNPQQLTVEHWNRCVFCILCLLVVIEYLIAYFVFYIHVYFIATFLFIKAELL